MAQLKYHYPNISFAGIPALTLKPNIILISFTDVRGNINTRLQKLDAGDAYDAIILAVAGLDRLNLSSRVSRCDVLFSILDTVHISQVLPAEVSMHAVGQGALAVECRENDSFILSLLAKITDPPTAQCCIAERSLLHQLQGGCRIYCDPPTLIHLMYRQR